MRKSLGSRQPSSLREAGLPFLSTQFLSFRPFPSSPSTAPQRDSVYLLLIPTHRYTESSPPAWGLWKRRYSCPISLPTPPIHFFLHLPRLRLVKQSTKRLFHSAPCFCLFYFQTVFKFIFKFTYIKTGFVGNVPGKLCDNQQKRTRETRNSMDGSQRHYAE